MTTTVLTLAVLIAVNTLCTDGFKFYQDQIPNGDHIPHPCKPNFLWEGVGHKNIGGGGERNPFGRDFARNEFKWNKCLCEHDSDGDGKTNGEELGDPNCVWKQGDIPEKNADLSHPGVCEPVDSSTCKEKNDWSFCDYGEFECDAINDTDVMEVVLKFPKTQVPAQETSYFCMHFDIPSDQDYHVIASKPLIDNKNVMHHIVVRACEVEDDDDKSWRLNEPQECGMANTRCSTPLPGWTVGLEGDCVPDVYGYKVGGNKIKVAMMQFHWNNPQLKSDYYDESGMVFYMTPRLRQYDAGSLALGTTDLIIPPAATSSSYDGSCSSDCTQQLHEPLYFSEVLFHMHYLGVGGVVEHHRDGEVIKVIEEQDYSYDNPITYRFDPPIEFLPGDELKATCTFKSTSRNTVTYYGPGTSDEMCFVFITYFPAHPDFRYCLSYKSVELCSIPQYNKSGCDLVADLTEVKLYNIVKKVEMFCNSTTETCPNGCEQAVAEIRADNPCFAEGDQGDYTETEVFAQLWGDYGRRLVALMHSCEEDWVPSFALDKDKTNPDNNTKRNVTTPLTPPKDDSDHEECVFGYLSGSTKPVVTGVMWLLIMLIALM